MRRSAGWSSSRERRAREKTIRVVPAAGSASSPEMPPLSRILSLDSSSWTSAPSSCTGESRRITSETSLPSPSNYMRSKALQESIVNLDKYSNVRVERRSLRSCSRSDEIKSPSHCSDSSMPMFKMKGTEIGESHGEAWSSRLPSLCEYTNRERSDASTAAEPLMINKKKRKTPIAAPLDGKLLGHGVPRQRRSTRGLELSTGPSLPDQEKKTKGFSFWKHEQVIKKALSGGIGKSIQDEEVERNLQQLPLNKPVEMSTKRLGGPTRGKSKAKKQVAMSLTERCKRSEETVRSCSSEPSLREVVILPAPLHNIGLQASGEASTMKLNGSTSDKDQVDDDDVVLDSTELDQVAQGLDIGKDQDFGSWLNDIDKDLLQDDDAVGLQIPTDDISEIMSINLLG